MGSRAEEIGFKSGVVVDEGPTKYYSVNLHLQIHLFPHPAPPMCITIPRYHLDRLGIPQG